MAKRKICKINGKMNCDKCVGLRMKACDRLKSEVESFEDEMRREEHPSRGGWIFTKKEKPKSRNRDK